MAIRNFRRQLLVALETCRSEGVAEDLHRVAFALTRHHFRESYVYPTRSATLQPRRLTNVRSVHSYEGQRNMLLAGGLLGIQGFLMPGPGIIELDIGGRVLEKNSLRYETATAVVLKMQIG